MADKVVLADDGVTKVVTASVRGVAEYGAP
jgi:hypothetical protein